MGQKISLIKKPEELEAERALKQRELEAAIQAENLDRQERIVALHKKQKTMKIIIISILVIFFIAMLTFGTYNTFFKHVLDNTDVQRTVNGAINTYPVAGLDNYIRDNCEGMFVQNLNYDISKYDYVTIDRNSVYISKVRTQSNTLAEVWFSADVTVKESDTKVTDPAIIERLHKNGFGAVEATPTPIPTPVPQETVPTETVVENADVIEPVDNIDEMVYTGGAIDVVPLTINYDPETPETSQETQPAETSETQPDATQPSETQPIETQPTETQPTTNPDDKEIGTVSVANSKNDERTEYYIVGNGTIYQRGKVITQRYNFYVPIEYYSVKDSDDMTVIAQGYRPASKLNIYVLNDINQTEFEKIIINDSFSFEGIAPVEPDDLTAAKIRVNAILDDLYSGRDTSQSFFNYKTFNTYGASYGNMITFELYTDKNKVGFNAYCEYTIITEQGFTYQVNCYMVVEPVGSGQSRTWKITRIM